MVWLDVLVWSGVGAAGIALAWLLDGWAQRQGRSRLVALLGLLPVLVYGLAVIGVFARIDADTPYMLISEARRVEQVIARLLSACGAIAAAVLVGLLARRSWGHIQQGGGVDRSAAVVATVVGLLGVAGAFSLSLAFGAIHPADPRLIVSVVLVLLAVTPGAVHSGSDPQAEAGHRLTSAVLAGLAGLFLVASFVGRTWQDALLPMWPVARPYIDVALRQGALEGLAWGAVPLLAGLATLLGQLKGLRPVHLAPVGVAAGVVAIFALPTPWVVWTLSAHEDVFDFGAVVGEVDLPTDDRSITGPVHGCAWRWSPTGGAIVATQQRVPSPACDTISAAEAEFMIAPAGLLLVDLPIVIDAPYDVDVLTLLVRTSEAEPYPLRLVAIEHDPDGVPMAARTLQEVVRTCRDDRQTCNLEPWAR